MGILGVIFVVLGFLLNEFVRLLNHGMPVLGLSYPYEKWVPLTSKTFFGWAGDVIDISRGIWSIGDLFMIAGSILIIGFLVNWIFQKHKLKNHEDNEDNDEC